MLSGLVRGVLPLVVVATVVGVVGGLLAWGYVLVKRKAESTPPLKDERGWYRVPFSAGDHASWKQLLRFGAEETVWLAVTGPYRGRYATVALTLYKEAIADSGFSRTWSTALVIHLAGHYSYRRSAESTAGLPAWSLFGSDLVRIIPDKTPVDPGPHAPALDWLVGVADEIEGRR